ncbi:NAD(P)-dependent alcohol dehydrogenase [Rhodococcus sp. BP-316]|uniref:NAD(P)-dependent alcohol dehydrogenase n=1 Tax=Rhodococcus sp. BP-316 TaxID=2739445 RepID=UPI001C9BA229|nr:NAD(P)-dependent alcohol dehydrogenase [Rhodococcus sp. BP-316]MBY6682858.1 NAD(P)-dependent alcohol dehydrogenase [Rhodococcus sp. BP-316]MBY6707585.1 NAD(P)-dependent alcohol dehydrogenase [Rhodococcus sp. BP-241]
MRTVAAYSASVPGAPLIRDSVEQRDLRADDVAVLVSHCGVCHSDLHALRDDAGSFPLTPGHEFVGTVLGVGSDVTDFAPGDPVAVGNIVDSCGVCDMCAAGQENYCREFPTLTYGGRDRVDGSTTAGAFSAEYVVRDRFVYHRPKGLDAAAVAPLMCAGISVWEPLRRWGVGPGSRVGVAGIGGLGHLAVRFAAALGAEVTVFTTSSAKAEEARELGAHHTVRSTDDAAMAAVQGGLDLVVDCIPVAHDPQPYLASLALDGTLCLVGHLGSVSIETVDLLVGRTSVSSSGSGGRRHTQEMLDFCGDHGITAQVEVLPSALVGIALDRLEAGDVRYRFVLDMGDLVGDGTPA